MTVEIFAVANWPTMFTHEGAGGTEGGSGQLSGYVSVRTIELEMSACLSDRH